MFELMPHTGDIRVRVAAGTLPILFAEAVRAMMFVLQARPDPSAVPSERHVSVHSTDRTALLVDFLNELLGLSAIRAESFSTVLLRSLTETSLEADVLATRAQFGEEIKAVTYHEANVAQGHDGTWSTMLVFDL